MRRPAATAVLGLVVLSALGLPAVPAGAATTKPGPAIAGLKDTSVSITVTDIRTSTPVPSEALRPLTLSLHLTNNTGSALKDVSITAVRGDPIDAGNPVSTQSALDAAIEDPQPPTPELVSPVDSDPTTLTLAANGSADADFTTTTSTDSSLNPGICLCRAAIYPLVFTASYTDSAGTTTTVGTTQTVIPSFGGGDSGPAPLKVSWVWPLLDRPHRLGSELYFLDDQLADEVAAGGRLDRALRSVELVSPDVAFTLLVDPDLLDELEVMSTGRYRVYDQQAKAGYVQGAGADAATAWLDRFRTLLADRPDVELQLTPFADPDVESLTSSGLSWAASMTDQAAQTRLAQALGGRTPQRSIAWPMGGALSAGPLAEVVRQGAGTVVLNDTTLPRGRNSSVDNALAPVQTTAGPAVAAVTSTRLERYVHSVLLPGGAGLAALPELVAQLALRSLNSPDTSHFVVLTTPRQLDVRDPVVAARAITATTRALWNTSLSLGTATRSVTAANHGVLHADDSQPGMPNEALDAITEVDAALPGLTGEGGLFAATDSQGASANSAALSAGKLAIAAQRASSVGLIDDPARSAKQAGGLARLVRRISGAVHLVKPAGNATYTLTSSDAPLPVTVTNSLDVPVQARITVTPVANLPGFSAKDLDIRLPANSTQQLRIPTRIELTGRIQVNIALSTRNGQLALGNGPLVVSVRNTALGTVGVAITTIAAIVLALALLFRLYRAIRWRRRRDTSGPRPPVTDPLAE